jgi:pimeloyl-ACP methyl ester carboxylesterase
VTGISETQVEAGGLTVGALVAGPEGGPLALCLHGFPDTAHTYRHLLPELAAAGFRAVAPFSRGYAPTDVPADGRYQTGALARDANALHEALGGDERAVIVGHDWGAQATYGAAGSAPDRWRKVVAMAVPVGPALAGSFFTYDQIKRSFYMYFFQNPLADVLVAADDQAFIARLWADWSPGYDATEDLALVRAALGTPENLAAALGYYRALFDPSRQSPELAVEQQAVSGVPPQPTLYLHGAQDG